MNRPLNPILVYLRRHYRDGVLPQGTLTAVGARFGVSHERVRQLAQRDGFVLPHEAARRKREAQPNPRGRL